MEDLHIVWIENDGENVKELEVEKGRGRIVAYIGLATITYMPEQSTVIL